MAPVAVSEGNKHDHVCLGGTFDTIHDGHKMLLSKAISLTRSRLIVGVTDGSMVKNKVLWELIKPVDERINKLRSYLMSLGHSDIIYDIVPISDPFGPSIEDPLITCIVVSQETIKGGQKINQIRKDKGMKELEIVIIDLVPETTKESKDEDDKISSSTARMRLLGTLLKEPGHDRLPFVPGQLPYLIGLTGGIASGKTSIASILESLGAGVINCDLIAHKSYDPGSDAYKQLIDSFGVDIVDTSSKHINRQALGSKVFSSPESLKKLESIVWPATRKLVDNQIDVFKSQNKEVVVIEASQLIEANWSKSVHQVWVTFIPEKEAIKRLYDRNKLSEEESLKRIKVQMRNEDRIKFANVVFCTLWDREFTRTQVVKAWTMLMSKFLRK